MGIKINHIIVLENNEEYIVIKETMYLGKKYFLAMALDKDRKVIADKVVILEEYVSGFESFVSKVNETELLTVLTRIFKAQL